MVAMLPAMLFSVSSYAQSPEPELPPVVVTGTRFAQGLADDPVRTIVVSSDDIQRSGARTVVDVLGQQTGIQLIDASGSPNKQIDLRGFGMSGDQNTLILLNGQRITENELASADLASIPLDSVERIEILRGSGAVLYGRGATGGTINIITKGSATAGTSGKLGVTAGSFNSRGVAGSASLASGLLGLTVFADKNQTDNYRVNNRLNQENLTTELTYRGQNGPVSLRYSTGRQELRLPGERTETQLITDRRGAATPKNYADLTSSRLALSTEQKMAFGSLAIDVARRERESVSYFDYGGGYYSYGLTKSHADSISPRVQLPFAIGSTKHALVVGADWDKWEWRNADPIDVSPPSTVATATQTNQALYIRDAIDFGQGSSVAVGVRRHKVSTVASEDSYGTINDGRQNRTLNVYEVAFRQLVGEATTYHARVGTSFRTVTVDELRTYGSPLRMLAPQTSKDIDVGVRQDYERGFVGLSVFHMKIDNEIHMLGSSGNVNLPPSERRGIETEGQWGISKAVSLQGNLTLTEAKFRSGTDGSGVSLAGKDVPLVPKTKAGLALLWKASEKSSATLRATYVGAARLDNDQNNNSPHMRPAYTVTDLVLVHDEGPWRLRFSALNLLDQKYFSYGIEAPARQGYNAYPAPGRNFLITAERRF